MRILFTGASSFTGLWFVRELGRAGHDVTAVFRRAVDEYPDELRRERAALASRVCRPVYGVTFGGDEFLDVVRAGEWDVLAHHAAEVTDYKSPDFDVVRGLRGNTLNLARVLDELRARGCRGVVLTGSVFEGGEGAGSEGRPDFSAYGLSKAITARVFRYYCARAGLHFGKFVVPNPFGPYEEPRYTAYLAKSWLSGEVARCATPAYVRDNIHVSLLAKSYARFVSELPVAPGSSRINPSGYPESQGAFTLRFAAELRKRLGVPCEVELRDQAEFVEPRVRINTDVPDARALGFSETQAWDDLAAYYRRRFGPGGGA